ncbi:MAG TPA: hypothetical protein VEI96_11515 [Thermodesulfovibrionales bacterium]|nr:hypothetical protein [Thermodesulfovibrionales bacterium]
MLGGSGVTAITGGWTWKCKSQDKLLAVTCNATQGTPTPINGDCGTANGATLSSAPTSGLCSVGTATTVNGTGPWTWTCQGSNGGNNDSCTAYTSSSTGYQGTYLAMNSNPTFDNLGGGQTRLYYFTLPANCGGNGQLRIATNQQQSAPHVAAVVKKTNGSNTTPPPTMADYNTLLTLWGPTNAGTKSQDGIYFTAFNFGSPTGETITIGTAAADKNKTWYTPDWQQFDTYYVLLVNTTSTVTAGWINAYCY